MCSFAKCRATVPWRFGEIKTNNYFDFKSELKIGLSSVGIIYLVCWILGNVQSSLYGNKVADFCEINPITFMFCYCPETKNYRTSNKHPGFQ